MAGGSFLPLCNSGGLSAEGPRGQTGIPCPHLCTQPGGKVSAKGGIATGQTEVTCWAPVPAVPGCLRRGPAVPPPGGPGVQAAPGGRWVWSCRSFTVRWALLPLLWAPRACRLCARNLCERDAAQVFLPCPVAGRGDGRSYAYPGGGGGLEGRGM